MPVRNKPLLNVLERPLFEEWLDGLADRGDVAGETGGSSVGFDPFERFLSDVLGWQGRIIRFEYIREDAKKTHYRLPGWAVEFQALIDKEELDCEEDGVTTLISAERCLEILATIP